MKVKVSTVLVAEVRCANMREARKALVTLELAGFTSELRIGDGADPFIAEGQRITRVRERESSCIGCESVATCDVEVAS